MVNAVEIILEESVHPEHVSFGNVFVSQSSFCRIERTDGIKEEAETHLHPTSEFVYSEDCGEKKPRYKGSSGSQSPVVMHLLGYLNYFQGFLCGTINWRIKICP